MHDARLLKKDLFGEVWQRGSGADCAIVRDVGASRWWIRWLARMLLRREARALGELEGLPGIPQLHKVEQNRLIREHIAGTPMHVGRPRDRAYFTEALRLLRRVHRRGVVHNDLAKEPNLLVREDGGVAFVDFQLARCSRRRGRLFRIAAREDLRHLLKHKRTYRPADLTARQRQILATPSPLSRAWMGLVKPVYLFVTRRIIGWSDREGAGDRGRQA